MKITIESTEEIAIANGLPVRLWRGHSEAGTPVVALITRIGSAATTDAAHTEFERDLHPDPPTMIDGTHVTLAFSRTCTTCNMRGRPGIVATHVAHGVNDCEWFECDDHEAIDNECETERIDRTPLDEWFKRYGLPVPGHPGTTRASALEASARSPLVRDFHALYRTACRTLHLQTFAQTVDARAGLSRQLERLKPTFDDCAAALDGRPSNVREALAGFVSAAEIACDALGIGDAAPHARVSNDSPRARALRNVVDRLLLDPRVIEVADPHVGARFLAAAMRGAQAGWHARVVHPQDVDKVRALGAPFDAEAREAWLCGFNLASAPHSETASASPHTDPASYEPPPEREGLN